MMNEKTKDPSGTPPEAPEIVNASPVTENLQETGVTNQPTQPDVNSIKPEVEEDILANDNIEPEVEAVTLANGNLESEVKAVILANDNIETAEEAVTVVPVESSPEGQDAAEQTQPLLIEEEPEKCPQMDEVVKICTQMGNKLSSLNESFSASISRFDSIDSAVGQLINQVSYLPPQIKSFGRKIEELNTSISESKYNNLLKSLLMIYDLVEQSSSSLNNQEIETTIDDQRRNLDVLKTQLLQIFEMNGLSQIPTAGKYNPKIHKALKSEPVDDPAQDGANSTIFRAGFTTGNQILRHAEVAVGKYTPPPEPEKETLPVEPEEEMIPQEAEKEIIPVEPEKETPSQEPEKKPLPVEPEKETPSQGEVVIAPDESPGVKPEVTNPAVADESTGSESNTTASPAPAADSESLPDSAETSNDSVNKT
jgi:molecular chaperone GrpE